MEKAHQEENKNQSEEEEANKYPLLWDCGSSLYDSFELNSFERQLDSAIISSRTLSMPRLSDSRATLPPSPVSKRPSKISRSIHKLLRSVFRLKTTSDDHKVFRVEERSREGFYVVYDRSVALSTIPEVPEMGGDYLGSPEFDSVVRRTASERFPATSVGISCA